MKSLTIIRHAKAERPEEYEHDFDRPLTDRGRKDAVRLAELLTRCEPPVDWWISSPAVRARETTELLRASYGYTKKIMWEPAVFEATSEGLLALLAQLPQDIHHAVLVGHNPGLTALVAGLTAGDPGRLNLHLATAGVAHLSMEIFWWNQIRWGCGQLELLLAPKIVKK